MLSLAAGDTVVAQLPYKPYIDPGYTLMGGYRDSDSNFFDYAIGGGMGMSWNADGEFENKQQWWADYKAWYESSPTVKYNLPSAYFGIGAAYGLGANLTNEQVTARMDSWLAPEPGIETYPELIPAFIVSEENYTGSGKWELLNTTAQHVMENYGIPVFQWLLPDDPEDGGVPGTEPDPNLAAGGWALNPVFHVDQDQFRKLAMKYVSMGKPVNVNIWASDPEWHHDYGGVDALIEHGQGQFDVAKEFNLNASIFSVVDSSVNVWKGSPREDIAKLRDWIADVRSDMNTVEPGMREPMESANYSIGGGIAGGNTEFDLPMVYHEDFLGFDWIDDAHLSGFLDLTLTSAPETNPGHLLAKAHVSEAVDASLIYEIWSETPLAYVSVELVGAASSATGSQNTISISVDGVNWIPLQQQAGNEDLQWFGATATNSILQGANKAYIRIGMENGGGIEAAAANILDNIKITTGAQGHAIWWNDWGTEDQQGAWLNSTLSLPDRDLDADGLAGLVTLGVTDGKSYWGSEKIEAPVGALISDIFIEWDVRVFESLGYHTIWGIEISSTGEFSGEQFSVDSSDSTLAFGWDTLVLDLIGNADYSSLPYFYLRLWVENNATGLAAQAEPLRIYGNYVAAPEPATLVMLLTAICGTAPFTIRRMKLRRHV